jgi:serine/threonine-protein kinase
MVRKRLESPPRAQTEDGLADALLSAMAVDPLARPSLAALVAAPRAPSPAAVARGAVAGPMPAPAPQPLAAALSPDAAPATRRSRRAAVLVAVVLVVGASVGALVLSSGREARVSMEAPAAPISRAEAPLPTVAPVPTQPPAEVAPTPPPPASPPAAPSLAHARQRARRPPGGPMIAAPALDDEADVFGSPSARGGLGGGAAAPVTTRQPRATAPPEGRTTAPPDPAPMVAPSAVAPLPQPAPSAVAPLLQPAPATRVAAPRERPLTPWVLIGSGAALGLALASVLAARRRARSVATRVPEAPSTRPDDVPLGVGAGAFAQTLPDARERAAQASSRRCVACGQSVPDDARFCPFDGAPLTASQPASGPRVTPQSALPHAFLVGPYECVEALGEGGMGVVYKARHVHLGRLAAVKVLLPGAGLDEARVALFRREARLAASVQHPNSVTIYDFGELQGAMLYLAMELVEGETLEAAIDGRAMDPARVAAVVRQLGEGLDAAHRAGVVHRDLKPANVMLCGGATDPRVKIVDFGIARGVMDPRATEAGRVMGTLPYMAPEQARGDVVVDARADVFSFAVVAYEMLTGALPFDDHTRGCHMARLQRVMLATPPPPVRARSPSLPEAVDGCLRRALMPDVDRRTASAGAFARELCAALGAA